MTNKIRLFSPGRARLRAGVLALIAATAAGAGGGSGGGGTDPTPTPSGEITVAAERQARWVYQRVGTSKAIAVSGTSTAPAGTVIEARAVDEVTGNAIQDWAVLGTVGADGTYSGTLTVQQGKWYRRQVRVSGSATAIATETNSFGIGLGVAEVGQSNMFNFKSTGFKNPLGDPAAFEYNGLGILRRVGNINDKIAPNTLYGSGGYGTFTSGGSRADGYVFVANLLAQNTGLPVFVINLAKSGSTIDSWMNDGSSNNWKVFADGLNSIGGDCEFALWLQGESSSTMASATYKARLSSLMGQFHALTGRDANSFKFGVISLGPSSLGNSYAGSSTTNFGRLRAAQCEWANSTAGAFFVTAAHDADLTNASDTIHIGGEQFSALGRRYAKSILAQLGIGTSAAGPRIVSATRVGTTVSVRVQHTGGTALQDGVGNAAGPSLGGFQFLDGSGTEIGITGSAITGPDTFVLYLASAPAGQCTLSYASQNAPHNLDRNDVKSAFLPESILRDNAAYYKTALDTPLGSPLQPCAALVVTGG